MVILGLWDGTPASAAIFVNGQLIAAVAEERLTRRKNEYGFPKNAIDCVLQQANLTFGDIDRVAMSTTSLSPNYFYTRRNATFAIKDYWTEQYKYWRPKFFNNESPSYLDLFKHRIDLAHFPYDQSLIQDENDASGMWEARKKHASENLGISEDNISVHDHHKCHANYGRLMSPFFTENALILTLDGNGDNTNAMVSLATPGSPLEIISRSSNCNIGRIYRYATLLLGMRPADHEYKVMGLAAYNSEKFGQEAYEIYEETLDVKGLGFFYKKEIPDHFFYFKEKLEGQRFDAIAFGVQKFTETLLTKWVANAIKETGISNVIMSGGVAQNIKANKCVAELDEVDRLFIPPGPGDESIAIGAAYSEFVEHSKEYSDFFGQRNAYFGPSFPEADVLEAFQKLNVYQFAINKTDDTEVAKLLAEGEVVARFGLGPMEFGARALGNRSILADPRRPDAVNHINKLVKMRDFWMPFAPSILAKRIPDYVVNPKGIDSKYMAVGFDSTELARSHLAAGLHPFDKTMRPQMVYESDNPKYHSLITAFEEKTGVGGLLNTSFNIHGEPIVGNPADALDTLSRCGLKHLYIGDWLVSKIA